MKEIVGGKSIEQVHALALFRQRYTCPVCVKPIKPGMVVVHRLTQLVHKDCGITYIAPHDDGTPFIHPPTAEA